MTTFDSPIGRLAAAMDEAGGLMYLHFLKDDTNPVEALLVRKGWAVQENDDRFTDLRRQLEAYWQGTSLTFNVPLAPAGSSFQHRVWSLLRDIPPGETRTYGQLANMLNSPYAARAVGRANATNPIAVIVPCHRVIGASGSLTGFAGGIERKRWLLDHEQKSTHRYH